MSIINKPPQHVKREYELEEPVALVVEKYATFIDSTPDHVVNSALKMLLWKDKHFMNWRKQQQQAARKDVPTTATQKVTGKSMMQRILNSKNLVAFVLAAATGMTLYFRMPFPEGNIFLRVMALRSPSAFRGSEVLVHFISVLDPVHWLFRCVLRLVHFCAQGEATNPSWQIAPLPRPPEERRSFPRRRRGSQSPETSPRGVPAVARHPREGLVHWRRNPRRNRVGENELLYVSVRRADSGLPRGRHGKEDWRPCS